MKQKIWLTISLAVISPLICAGCGKIEGSPVPSSIASIALPEPRHDSDVSLEETLLARRSVRNYSGQALTLQQVSQLLWAGQGITDPSGKRTAPSAGGLYPLKVYVVTGNVEGVAAGVYRYEPATHMLTGVMDGDQRQALSEAALGQAWVKEGAIDIVIAAVYEITTSKYGERGERYVHMEAGHAAQNICLQAVALQLGLVTVGAFDDTTVQKILGLPDDEVPLYIIPVGIPAE